MMQNGWAAIINPVMQGVILVVLVAGLVRLGSQLYLAVVGQ